ncbi:MAG TPA: hypothetical protein PKD45_04790 [Flavobacteriales bacterium]|nr:hypothetical protein [Flavobacteriales bacterium]
MNLKKLILRPVFLMLLFMAFMFLMPMLPAILPDDMQWLYLVIFWGVVGGSVLVALWGGYKALRIGSKIAGGNLKPEDIDGFIGVANKFTGMNMTNPLRDMQKDIPNGLPATATVISCSQGNSRMSMGVHQYFQLVIQVSVRNDRGETWPATITQMVPLTQVGIFQPGVAFAVKYDPDDRSNVVIDQSGAPGQGRAVDIPGYGHVDGQAVAAAKMAAPPELIMQLQANTALLKQLLVTGRPAQAKVLSQAVYHENLMPGSNVLQLRYRYSANGADLEHDELVLTPKAAMYKTVAGQTIHVRYDPANPRRVAMSGTDKENTTLEV